MAYEPAEQRFEEEVDQLNALFEKFLDGMKKLSIHLLVSSLGSGERKALFAFI